MELVKMPLAAPSVVFEFDVVGVCDVLQQIPRAVIAEPPSSVISPPPEAVVDVKMAAAEVESIGIRAETDSTTELP